MVSSRLIEEDDISPKVVKTEHQLFDEIPAKGLDTPGRAKTAKIESNTPRILIDHIEVHSLSLNEQIMEEEEKHKSMSGSSEGGKTPLFGAKTKGKNFNQ